MEMIELIEILVRYGEISLKSPGVRKRMTQQLIANISGVLQFAGYTGLEVVNRREWGRILVRSISKDKEYFKEYSKAQEVAELISNRVMGVVSTSPVIRTDASIQAIEKTTKKVAKKALRPKASFAVRARRDGKHPYTSIELEREIGGKIHQEFAEKLQLTVDLTNPDITLAIEVRQEIAFVYDKVFTGYGGLPQGTQGMLAAILRDSPEDAIAAFLMAKRGAFILPFIFYYNTLPKSKESQKLLQEQIKIFQEIQPKNIKKCYLIDLGKLFAIIGEEKIHCSLCDQICINLIESKVSKKRCFGIVLGNSYDSLLNRVPEKSVSEQRQQVYYPLIALRKEQVKQPFSLKSAFCLNLCPGYENQKKKEYKPLSNEELRKILANAKVHSIDLQLISEIEELVFTSLLQESSIGE